MFLPHSQLLDSICWCLVRCGGRSWPSLYKAQRLSPSQHARMKTAVILSGSLLNDVVLSTPRLIKCLLVVYIFKEREKVFFFNVTDFGCFLFYFSRRRIGERACLKFSCTCWSDRQKQLRCSTSNANTYKVCLTTGFFSSPRLAD